MIKIGLKFWISNPDEQLRQAIKIFDEGIFDFVEIYLPAVTDELPDITRWLPFRKMPAVVHAPHYAHHFNLADSALSNSNQKRFRQVQRLADLLDAKLIICHGGTGGTVDETIRQILLLNDERIALENKPHLQAPELIPDPGMRCRGAKYDELKTIIEATKSHFCHDVVHAFCAANSFGLEPYSYIKQLDSLNPSIYHITDMISSVDELDTHEALGSGTLDIARTLRNISAEAAITLETPKPSNFDLNEFIAEATLLKDIAARL